MPGINTAKYLWRGRVKSTLEVADLPCVFLFFFSVTKWSVSRTRESCRPVLWPTMVDIMTQFHVWMSLTLQAVAATIFLMGKSQRHAALMLALLTFFFFFFNFPGHLPSAVQEDTPGLTREGNKSLSSSTSGQAWLVSAQHRCQRRFSTGARRVRNAHSHASLEAAKTIPN